MAHTTNYANTFIEVAEDCKNRRGEIPPTKNPRTVADLEYELIFDNPYKYTSDELLFIVRCRKNGIPDDELEQRKNEFFSKPQACLRSSPLSRTYGWGIHFNGEGRIALFGSESPEYGKFKRDENLKHLKAMRSSR